MADERRDRGARRRQWPSVELTNTPFALAADDTYSTTLRAFARGEWEGEIPEAIFYIDGERFGRAVPVQSSYANKAITGLGPNHHYLAEVAIGGQRAERLLMIPELPKRKTVEEEALERDKLKLDRAKVAAELTKLQKRPDSNEKKLADARLKLELARIDAELKKLDAAPSETERNVAEARLKFEQTKVEKEIAELERPPDQAEQELKERRLELERAKIEAELKKLRVEPPRPILKLSVEPLGFKPNLRFIVHLTDKEGRGTAGKVEISTYADPNFFETVEVDSSGSTIWPPRDMPAFTFPDRRRTYRFRIVGADLKDKERACECVVS